LSDDDACLTSKYYNKMEIKYATIWYSKIVLNHLDVELKRKFRAVERDSNRQFNVLCLE